MTSEEIDLLQGMILHKIQALKDHGELTRHDIFINAKTLRLRKHGMSILIKMYDNYKFDVNRVTTGQLVSLFQKMRHPYYLGPVNKIAGRKLVLFSEQDAFMCKLAGFDGWLEGK